MICYAVLQTITAGMQSNKYTASHGIYVTVTTFQLCSYSAEHDDFEEAFDSPKQDIEATARRANWAGAQHSTAQHAYRREAVLWLVQHSGASSQMVILQGRAVVVHDGQRVSSLDEEVIVDTAMLVVMHCGCPVRSQLMHSGQSTALQDAGVTDQHMCHLHNRGHMDAAGINTPIVRAGHVNAASRLAPAVIVPFLA